MADISEELLQKLNIDGSLSAKEYASMLLFNDENAELDDLRKKFKTNFLQKFKKELDGITTKDIKRIFDPLGLSDLLRDPESLRTEYKDYKDKLRKLLRKAKQNLEKDDTEILEKEEPEKPKKKKNKNQDLNFSTENISDNNLIEKQEKTNTGTKEQREFGEKATVIEFSEKTNKFISDLMERYSTKNSDMMKELSSKTGKKENKNDSGSALDLLGYVVVGGLLATFWKSHIRPFLEEKFGFMDKLVGTFNLLEKGLFTMLTAIPKAGLNLLSTISKASGQIVDFIIDGVKGMVGGLFGVGEKAVGKAGAEAAGKAATKGLFGKLLAGLGKSLIAIKWIPVIGSLISFWFAYDRAQQGDTVGAWIDVIGGIGSLLSAIPGPTMPIGAAISWGALALNAVLDMAAEGKTPEEKNKSKVEKLKNWAKAPFEWLAKSPFIRGLLNSISGLAKLAVFDFSGGIKDIKDSWLAPIASGIEWLFGDDSQKQEPDQKYTQPQITAHNQTTKPLPKPTPKPTPTSTPKEKSEPIQPVDESEPENAHWPAVSVYNPEPKMAGVDVEDYEKEKERLLKEREEVKKRVEKLKTSYRPTSSYQNIKDTPFQKELDSYNELNKQIEEINGIIKTFDEKVPTSLDDGEVEYSPKLKLNGNTIASFSPQDSFKITAAKPDGTFDKMNKNLTDSLQKMTNEFSNIGKMFMQSVGSNSIVNINNTSSGRQNPFMIVGVDPILRSRTSYIQSPLRVV